jgi:hypothetical protein
MWAGRAQHTSLHNIQLAIRRLFRPPEDPWIPVRFRTQLAVLFERSIPTAADFPVVDENILCAAVRSDKTDALIAVEPFHSSVRQAFSTSVILSGCRKTPGIGVPHGQRTQPPPVASMACFRLLSRAFHGPCGCAVLFKNCLYRCLTRGFQGMWLWGELFTKKGALSFRQADPAYLGL